MWRTDDENVTLFAVVVLANDHLDGCEFIEFRSCAACKTHVFSLLFKVRCTDLRISNARNCACDRGERSADCFLIVRRCARFDLGATIIGMTRREIASLLLLAKQHLQLFPQRSYLPLERVVRRRTICWLLHDIASLIDD
jgi:hypothetical protein